MIEPDSFHTCASGGLGHGLPAAVGVALGLPTRKVIGLIGDGSAMYSIQGLWTAAELQLPVAFVIVNNRSYQALVEFGKQPSFQGLGVPQCPHHLPGQRLAVDPGGTYVHDEQRPAEPPGYPGRVRQGVAA